MRKEDSQDLPSPNHGNTCVPLTATQMLLPTPGGLTLVHGRRNRPAEPQGLLIPERPTEVLQHGYAQALAPVSPPDEHGVEDGQLVAGSRAIAAQATCRGERGTQLCPGPAPTRQAPQTPARPVTGPTRHQGWLRRPNNGRQNTGLPKPPFSAHWLIGPPVTDGRERSLQPETLKSRANLVTE